MNRLLAVYDNGGKTLDRYTVIVPDGAVYAMSENATSPQGVNLYAGDIKEIPDAAKGAGKRIPVKMIPDIILTALFCRGYSAREMCKYTGVRYRG